MNTEIAGLGTSALDELLDAMASPDRAVYRNAIPLIHQLLIVLRQQDDPAWLWDEYTKSFWLRAFLYHEFRWLSGD